MAKIRTRFAPSPTGDLHIGSLRTALYSYVLAKHDGGDFVLRIEDTDKKREVPGSKEEIKKYLKEFGLVWDEYYVQSERLSFYQKAAEKLVKDGHAFYCQCDPKNAKKQGYSKELRDPCRNKSLTSGAIKLRVPDNQIVKYRDFVLSQEISWKTDDVFEATLLKSDGFPTYHLAAVVDDLEMKISHVLRGYDWLPSTPIHLLVYQFLKAQPPEIGHLTDILDPEGGKLSKRKGSVSIKSFLAEGYLPEALLNFVMLLGWAPKNNQEIFSLKEFVNVFDSTGLQKSNPVFDRNKLLWMNGEYIRKMQDSKLKRQVYEFFNGQYVESLVAKLVPLVKTRIKTLKEFDDLCRFFLKAPKVAKDMLGKNYQVHLKAAIEALEKGQDLEKVSVKKGFKTGEFFMDLRITITGSRVTPPINESIAILGKEESLARLKRIK